MVRESFETLSQSPDTGALVQELAAFSSTDHCEPGGTMAKAHGGIGGIDRLPSGSGAAKRTYIALGQKRVVLGRYVVALG